MTKAKKIITTLPPKTTEQQIIDLIKPEFL